MKIQITGTYRKTNNHWEVLLPSLSIKVEDPHPFRAFKCLEELIQKEIGLDTECSFKISDDGQFELNTSKSPEFVNYIAKRISEHTSSYQDLLPILAQIRFKEDLDE